MIAAIAGRAKWLALKVANAMQETGKAYGRAYFDADGHDDQAVRDEEL